MNQAERSDWLYTKILDFPASSLTRGAGVYLSDKAAIETYTEDETDGNFARGMKAVASRATTTLVVTRDQAGTVASYVGGVPANTPVVDSRSGSLALGSGSVYFFMPDVTGLDNTQSGSIDDIRIWNSVLTPSDISGL